MEVGVALDIVWPWPRLHGLAQLAGEHGYDQIWVSDHPLGRDPFVSLLDLSTVIGGARLGLATINPSARHPAVLAASAATLNHLTGRGFWLGIGSSNASLLNPLGLEATRQAERCRDAVAIIRQLLETEASTFSSSLFSTTDARLLFDHGAPVPVLVGTSGGPAMLRISGQVASGIIIPAGTLDFYRHVIAGFRTALREAGRTDAVSTVAIVTVAVADEPDIALECVRPLVAQAISYRAKTPHALDVMGITAEQARIWSRDPQALPDAVIRAAAVVGTPSECVDGLLRFAELGTTQVVIRFPDEVAIRRIADQVLPALRRQLRASHTSVCSAVDRARF
jgi:alkanesulfonate monooxygenase SsuD/methylene tetrahydromethanopterin reductase-like flavin-dependent oxidoreductase (luciferase family)